VDLGEITIVSHVPKPSVFFFMPAPGREDDSPAMGFAANLVERFSEGDVRCVRAALAEAEAFLDSYDLAGTEPAERLSAGDTLLRLAELYRGLSDEWAIGESAFLDYTNGGNGSYGELSPAYPDFDSPPRTVELLRWMVDQFPEHPEHELASARLAYMLSRIDGATQECRAALLDLLQQHPASPHASWARIMLANSFFEAEEYEPAAENLSAAALQRKGNTLLPIILYHLSFCRFKLGQYEQGLLTLWDLLAMDDGNEDLKAIRDVKPEAITAAASALFDLDWNLDSEPDVQSGQALFSRAATYLSGGRPFEADVWFRFGGLLRDYGDEASLEAASLSFAEFLKRYPLESRAPEVHDNLITTYWALDPLAKRADGTPYSTLAGSEADRLPELYGRRSAWAVANRGDAEVMGRAEARIASRLKARAMELHARAQQAKTSGQTEEAGQLYAAAAARYRQFISEFPSSAVALEAQWWLANAEYHGVRSAADAAASACSLRDNTLADNPYRVDAAALCAAALLAQLRSAIESPDARPALPPDLLQTSVRSYVGGSDPPVASPPAPVAAWLESVDQWRVLACQAAPRDAPCTEAVEQSAVAGHVRMRYRLLQAAQATMETVLSFAPSDEAVRKTAAEDLVDALEQQGLAKDAEEARSRHLTSRDSSYQPKGPWGGAEAR
jgi:TolA-binding protein